jgi:hypothetical protein
MMLVGEENIFEKSNILEDVLGSFGDHLGVVWGLFGGRFGGSFGGSFG